MSQFDSIKHGDLLLQSGDTKSAFAAFGVVAENVCNTPEERAEAYVALGDCIIQDPNLGGENDDCGLPMYLNAIHLRPQWSVPYFYVLMTYKGMSGWHENETDARHAARALQLMAKRGVLEIDLKSRFEEQLARLGWLREYRPDSE